MNKLPITEFFKNDYVNFASYDNLRKIASIMDGQKNAARKVLYTVLEKNIKDEIKVSQLNSKAAEFAEYIHGSMDGVIVNLAKSYTGTNNLPLLSAEGNFGTRFSNEASASRYIFTYGTNNLFTLFNKDDTSNLIKQYFEGEKIEPRFYVPDLPIILINGAEGMSPGVSQTILPRDPKKISAYIRSYLENKNSRYKFEPYFEGFTGTVEQGETSRQWVIKGKVKRLSATRVEITEVPIGYDLKKYINELRKLEDKKEIRSFIDRAEDDNFRFEVVMTAKDLSSLTDEQLLEKLKLVKRTSEIYTCISEENKIIDFDGPKEIIHHFIKIKLEYLQKRKDSIIQRIGSEVSVDKNKMKFIEHIVNGSLIINNRKKDEIVKYLESNNFDKKDDSYDYLLNMNILYLTKERMQKFKSSIKEKEQELKKITNTTTSQMWLEVL